MCAAIDFRRVIAADGLVGAVVRQAASEHLLETRDPRTTDPSPLSEDLQQKALALIVLFDDLVLAVGSADGDSEPGWRIPALEDEGIAKIAVIDSVPRWRVDPRPESLARSLRDTISVRPLLLNDLCKDDDELLLFPKLAKFLAAEYRMTVKEAFNAILDFAIAWVESNADPETLEATADRFGIEMDVLRWMFTSADKILEELELDVPEGLKPSEDRCPQHIAFLLLTAISTRYLRNLLTLGIRQGAGVATERYSGSSDGWHSVKLVDSIAGRDFALLRSALDSEGAYFPRIDGIRHALHLRQHPALRAFRNQLYLLREHLAKGDAEASAALAGEVRKAKGALRRAMAGGRALNLVTYLSLPVAVIEQIASGPTYVGITLSLFSALGSAAIRGTIERSKWAMFGS